MGSRYVYDKDGFEFRKSRRSVRNIFLRIGKYFIASISLAVIYYIVFSLFISTDNERQLRSENRVFEKVYPEMEAKEQLLADVVEGLQIKDIEIYEEVFQSPLPSIDALYPDSRIPSDDASYEDIVRYTEDKIARLGSKSSAVNDAFVGITEAFPEDISGLPPLDVPFEDFSVSQTGASVGSKISPFYKVAVHHDGLDMVAPSGTPVYAPAAGVISDIERSKKKLGNVVTIDHGNGYVTKFAHLADISVLKGRSVKAGTKVGNVGMSGNSFAPHLHYEVWYNGTAVDPVNYMFAALTPWEYANMLTMSQSAGQSLD